jgi:hypothetical protein
MNYRALHTSKPHASCALRLQSLNFKFRLVFLGCSTSSYLVHDKSSLRNIKDYKIGASFVNSSLLHLVLKQGFVAQSGYEVGNVCSLNGQQTAPQ